MITCIRSLRPPIETAAQGRLVLGLRSVSALAILTACRTSPSTDNGHASASSATSSAAVTSATPSPPTLAIPPLPASAEAVSMNSACYLELDRTRARSAANRPAANPLNPAKAPPPKHPWAEQLDGHWVLYDSEPRFRSLRVIPGGFQVEVYPMLWNKAETTHHCTEETRLVCAFPDSDRDGLSTLEPGDFFSFYAYYSSTPENYLHPAACRFKNKH